MDGAAARGDRRWISGESDRIPRGDGGSRQIQATVSAMREQDSEDQVRVQRNQLLRDVPDRREIAGGSRVFETVTGGLAANARRVGDEDEREEGGSRKLRR